MEARHPTQPTLVSSPHGLNTHNTKHMHCLPNRTHQLFCLYVIYVGNALSRGNIQADLCWSHRIGCHLSSCCHVLHNYCFWTRLLYVGCCNPKGICVYHLLLLLCSFLCLFILFSLVGWSSLGQITFSCFLKKISLDLLHILLAIINHSFSHPTLNSLFESIQLSNSITYYYYYYYY